MAECSHVPPDTQTLCAFHGYSGFSVPSRRKTHTGQGKAGMCQAHHPSRQLARMVPVWENPRGLSVCYRGAKTLYPHLC